MEAKDRKPGRTEICILAAGLSTRMGCDKPRLRLGRLTMLGLVRATAKSTGLKVRVIRRDLVPRCGPLGGIYTALKATKAQRVLFLACDMPFVSRELLERFLKVRVRPHPGLLPALPLPSPLTPLPADGRGKLRGEGGPFAAPTRSGVLALPGAAFLCASRRVGFPLILCRTALDLVGRQIQKDQLSLNQLATVLCARLVTVPREWAFQLHNVNTVHDLESARQFLAGKLVKTR